MFEKEIIFNYFETHLLNDNRPSEYFNEEISTGSYFDNYPFKLLKALTDTPQSPVYHPEGSVWKHTMMVVDNAAQLKKESDDPEAFMWAALLHDIGKAPTTKVRRGKITSYDHDIAGADLSSKFMSEITNDKNLIEKVSRLVRWHMQPLFVSKNLPFSKINQMSSEVSIDEIALLSLCDRLGRGGMTEDKISEEKAEIKSFVNKCKSLAGKI